MVRVLGIVLLSLPLAACQIGPRASSPELLYSTKATEARTLQVPPDLSEVAEGEQFVLPGNTGAAITRNTLLPTSANVEFVRSGSENYLDIQSTPEEIWAQLQEFLRANRYPISQSEPVAGAVSSQWRPVSRGADRVSRVAFRLERGEGNTTRLFARQQVADSANASIDAIWPPSSHDPENTSELLVRVMVFLGVQEQRALEILSEEQVSAIFDEATLEVTSKLTYLDVHWGFLPAFEVVDTALRSISATPVNSDRASGKLEGTVDGVLVVYEIFPITSVATRVIMDPARRLSPAQKLKFLNSLRKGIV